MPITEQQLATAALEYGDEILEYAQYSSDPAELSVLAHALIRVGADLEDINDYVEGVGVVEDAVVVQAIKSDDETQDELAPDDLESVIQGRMTGDELAEDTAEQEASYLAELEGQSYAVRVEVKVWWADAEGFYFEEGSAEAEADPPIPACEVVGDPDEDVRRKWVVEETDEEGHEWVEPPERWAQLVAESRVYTAPRPRAYFEEHLCRLCGLFRTTVYHTAQEQAQGAPEKQVSYEPPVDDFEQEFGGVY